MTWVIAAIAAPAALMVVNPVHVAGTLVVAQVQEDKQNRTFRLLLSLAISMGVIAPLLLLIYPMTVV
jgi:putative transporter